MDTDDICLYGGRIAKARESMGTGPALGLLTTGGTPALGKFRERPTTLLTPSKLYSSAELTGSTKLARCWNDWYAVQSGSGQVMGKTNMTALGNFYQNGIPNGWSPMGGQVLSPFGAGFETGGSSTGSAVALAAGMSAAIIGAESCGSIVSISS
jgi:hypothetical protein